MYSSSIPWKNTPTKSPEFRHAAGQRYWDGKALAQAELETRLVTLGRQNPETELHLHADKSARYELVAELMTSASRAGLQRIGFITQASQ